MLISTDRFQIESQLNQLSLSWGPGRPTQMPPRCAWDVLAKARSRWAHPEGPGGSGPISTRDLPVRSGLPIQPHDYARQSSSTSSHQASQARNRDAARVRSATPYIVLARLNPHPPSITSSASRPIQVVHRTPGVSPAPKSYPKLIPCVLGATKFGAYAPPLSLPDLHHARGTETAG